MLGFSPICDRPICSTPSKNDISVSQSLNFSQQLNGGLQLITGANQSLTFTQSNLYTLVTKLLQTLTFVQTNVCKLTLFENIINNLVIGQTNLFHYINNVEAIQTLSFKQIAQANNNIYYLLCECLKLKQSFGNGFDISVHQTLSLQWLEREVYEQVLHINQLIVSNFDSIDCCEPTGVNESRDVHTSMNMQQSVGCGMVYNCNIVDSMGLKQTAAWT